MGTISLIVLWLVVGKSLKWMGYFYGSFFPFVDRIGSVLFGDGSGSDKAIGGSIYN